MIAIDAGILALAVNRWAPEHARAARLVEDLVNGETRWAVTWPALHELMRRLTGRDAVARPLLPADAAGVLDALLASPSLTVLGPGPGHAAALGELAAGLEHGIPAGFDSAVLLREHGVRELLTLDPGMRRYPFLSAIDPFHGAGWQPGRPPARRYRRLRAE